MYTDQQNDLHVYSMFLTAGHIAQEFKKIINSYKQNKCNRRTIVYKLVFVTVTTEDGELAW